MLSAALALLVVAVACGAAEPRVRTAAPGEDLALTLAHPVPLRSGAAVTWTLTVENRRATPVTLVMGSGQDGDVVLRRGDQERYRWSVGRMFTQAVRELPVAAGRSRSFTLDGATLDVEPGGYELEATLRSQPAPAAVREQVRVEGP